MIAPDKFKGSLSAGEAAAAIERGLRSALPQLESTLVPMADGGEGTVEAFVASGWQRIVRRVRGPLGRPVEAAFALSGTKAVVEMAAASGLALVAPDEREPLRASTFGTGELVAAALDLGAREIVVAVGGSATTDGGAGLLVALGVRLRDSEGRDLEPGGAALGRLGSIETAGLDPRLHNTTLSVAADVDNPLTGARGASRVFAAQKGASGADIETLEAALTRFAGLCAALLGDDRRDDPGVGAAGGLGFALRAYFGAALRPGVELIGELRGLGTALRAADWCFTGEGSIDEQTLGGKTVAGVAALARAAGVPTIAFAGRLTPGAERELARRGALAVPILDGPRSLESAVATAVPLLERAATRVAGLLLVGRWGCRPAV